jgi:hypothetical protein
MMQLAALHALFVRALGAVYAVALTSIAWQAAALVGPTGLTPARTYLARARRDFGALAAAVYFPSLFWWVGTSDAAVVGVPLVGALAGAVVAVGDVAGVAAWGGGAASALSGWSPTLLAVAWAAYLSCDFGRGAMWYPWDSLTLEAGFLALWLPPLVVVAGVPPLSLAGPMHPLLATAFRLLLARLLFGFGRLKFSGAHPTRDSLFIRPFLTYQPLPTRVGWLMAAAAPDWVIAGALRGMWVAEVLMPLALLIPGWPRVVAGVTVISLMVGIAAGGNYGHFQIMTAALAIPCLHPGGGSVLDALWQPRPTLSLLVALLGYVLPASAVYAWTNSWFTLALPYWPGLAALQPAPLVQRIMAALRALAPLRAVHGYGIFFASTGPPQRYAPVYERSTDGGRTWVVVPWRVAPWAAHTPPSTVAPLHPRLDHAVFYAPYGSDWHGLTACITRSSPYSYAPGGVTQWGRLAAALAGDRPALAALMGGRPADTAAPPPPGTLVRVSLVHLTQARTGTLVARGEWYAARRVGLYIGPTAVPGEGDDDRDADDDAAPCGPEAFGWEAGVWRARAVGKGVTVTRAEYDAAWAFVGAVRAAALAEATAAATSSTLTTDAAAPAKVVGARPPAGGWRMPPAPDGSVGVSALGVFDTAHARAPRAVLPSGASADVDVTGLLPLPGVLADALFTFAALPGVAEALLRSHTPAQLRRVRRTLGALALPLLRATDRLAGGPPPTAAEAAAEWDAAVAVDGAAACGDRAVWDALPTLVVGAPRAPAAGPTVTLNGVPTATVTYAGNDDAGAGGALRGAARAGMYAGWRALVGGRAAYEALVGGAPVGVPLAYAGRGADAVGARSRPALLAALGGGGGKQLVDGDGGDAGIGGPLSPARMATEAGYFMLGASAHALLAPYFAASRLMVAQSRPPPVAPPLSTAPAPGILELASRAAAHPECGRVWDAVARRLAPPRALPVWVEEGDRGQWVLHGYWGGWGEEEW